jgi:hypothetical protein
MDIIQRGQRYGNSFLVPNIGDGSCYTILFSGPFRAIWFQPRGKKSTYVRLDKAADIPFRALFGADSALEHLGVIFNTSQSVFTRVMRYFKDYRKLLLGLYMGSGQFALYNGKIQKGLNSMAEAFFNHAL